MKLTSEYLRKNNACQEQVKLFEQIFPHGASFTKRDFNRAIKQGLSVNWLVNCLPKAAFEEYKKICQSAFEEYDKTCQSAFEEYDKICQSAFEEFDKINQLAREEYEKLRQLRQLALFSVIQKYGVKP